MSKVRIGIAGYGNLGKGVELAIRQNDDMELAGIFTRRDPSTLKPLTAGAPVFSMDDLKNKKNDIDVLIICGGSATDLPKQTPELAKDFNVIDSFDTHKRIPEHFANVDKAAKESGHLHSSHSAGIPVFSHSTDFMPSLSSPTARAIHSGARA